MSSCGVITKKGVPCRFKGECPHHNATPKRTPSKLRTSPVSPKRTPSKSTPKATPKKSPSRVTPKTPKRNPLKRSLPTEDDSDDSSESEERPDLSSKRSSPQPRTPSRRKSPSEVEDSEEEFLPPDPYRHRDYVLRDGHLLFRQPIIFKSGRKIRQSYEGRGIEIIFPTEFPPSSSPTRRPPPVFDDLVVEKCGVPLSSKTPKGSPSKTPKGSPPKTPFEECDYWIYSGSACPRHPERSLPPLKDDALKEYFGLAKECEVKVDEKRNCKVLLWRGECCLNHPQRCEPRKCNYKDPLTRKKCTIFIPKGEACPKHPKSRNIPNKLGLATILIPRGYETPLKLGGELDEQYRKMISVYHFLWNYDIPHPEKGYFDPGAQKRMVLPEIDPYADIVLLTKDERTVGVAFVHTDYSVSDENFKDPKKFKRVTKIVIHPKYTNNFKYFMVGLVQRYQNDKKVKLLEITAKLSKNQKKTLEEIGYVMDPKTKRPTKPKNLRIAIKTAAKKKK